MYMGTEQRALELERGALGLLIYHYHQRAFRFHQVPYNTAIYGNITVQVPGYMGHLKGKIHAQVLHINTLIRPAVINLFYHGRSPVPVAGNARIIPRLRWQLPKWALPV